MSLDWMPIASAPHDVRILVYGEIDGVLVGIYSKILEDWYAADCYECNILTPTEWQPLPPPPVKEKG